MPRVDDEGEESDLGDAGSRGEEADGHELGGSRVDEEAHEGRHPPRLAGFDEKEAEGYPDGHVAEEDRHGRRESRPQAVEARPQTDA